MLLTIENFGSDVSSDVVGDIIAKNERNSLSFLQVNMADHPFSQHSWFLLFLESYCWANSILFTVVDCNIKLQLEILGCESNSLALEASWSMFWENYVGFVWAASIVECGKDLDICGGLLAILLH